MKEDSDTVAGRLIDERFELQHLGCLKRTGQSTGFSDVSKCHLLTGPVQSFETLTPEL
jgi:hypothetical protein